jgi:hypothetical protein
MINLEKTNKEAFIVIQSDLVSQTNTIASSAVLFPSFEEALEYARKEASHYTHLASYYTEKIGVGKLHADIQMRGKYIHKSFTIRDLNYDNRGYKVLETHRNTYASWDYDHEGIAI